MKMSNKFLSIIIPVYNCESYISECLDSCLEQDIPGDEYEIICVDDGSLDKSAQILDDYAEKHDNIKVFHKKNGGVSSARNFGIEKSDGKYLWFVDADDLIQENVLSSIKAVIESTDPDIVSLKGYFFNEVLTDEEKELKKQKRLSPRDEVIAWYVILKIFKRELIINNNIRFLESAKYGEDHLFNFECFQFTKKEQIIDFATYFYRVNRNSTMHNSDVSGRTVKQCASICEVVEFLSERYKDENDDQKRKTLKFIYDNRTYFVNRISLLSPAKAIKTYKAAKKRGIFVIENKMGIDQSLWQEPLHPAKYYLKNHKKYVWKNRFLPFWKEKIAARVCHPVRTVKNLFSRFSR